MAGIKLVSVRKPAGAIWHLDRDEDGLVLCDENDNVVLSMTAAEAITRIHMPSFWASRYIVIDPDRGEILTFEPKPKSVSQLRELLEECRDEDPGATAAVIRHKATRDLLIGGGALLLGVVVTAVSFATAAPGGTFLVMTGLLGVGVFKIIRGIYGMAKAGNQARRVNDQDD